jgi:putative ABC transport system permease protein
MRAILRDIRYGIRSLIKSPGLTLVALLALTLGIGLTTTMFSLVYGALIRGLPYPDGDRIAVVYRNNPSRGQRRMGVPIHDYHDYAQQQKSFGPFGAYYAGTVNVSGVAQAERYTGAFVTAGVVEVTGVQPLLGRLIRTGDDTPSGEKVAVISYAMWRTRFGGDTAAVGQTIHANGVPYTIVGVMPDGFYFPDDARIWLPLQMDAGALKRGDGQWLNVVGRLKPGITLEQATADFGAIAKRLQTDYKETNEGIGAVSQGFVDAALGPEPRQLLYTMLVAVFFVLLIACANVANLLLDRAAHKTKEVGIRTALGATRGAVIRQFLAEALALSLGAAVLGTAFAYGAIALFNRVLIANTDPPFFIHIRLDPPVLAFVAAMAVVSTLFSGAIPAYQSSRADINEVLKDDSRGASSFRIGRMSRALVVLEIALSCGLLVAAGLTTRSVTNLRNMDPGFRSHNVFTARIGFPGSYSDTVMQMQFFAQLRDRLAALPGVRAATLTSALPGVGSNGGQFAIDGVTYVADRDYPQSQWLAVTPGFFETFDVRATRGRVLASSDRADAPAVVVINQMFADRYFPKQDPIGRRIRLGARTSTQAWMTIVGIVPTLFSGNQSEPRAPAYYAPLSQHHSNFVSMAAQTSGSPMVLTTAVRQTVASMNRDIPIYWVYSMEEALARPLWFVRVFGTMFMMFGAVALFLAAVGLYAVMSFSVSRRSREVGIRMALGAQRGDVIGMIFLQGAWQLGTGLVLGLGLAAGVAQFMSVILFDVKPRDPAIFAGVIGVLATTGIVACLFPARRATRVDPLVALRAE